MKENSVYGLCTSKLINLAFLHLEATALRHAFRFSTVRTRSCVITALIFTCGISSCFENAVDNGFDDFWITSKVQFEKKAVIHEARMLGALWCLKDKLPTLAQQEFIHGKRGFPADKKVVLVS